MPFNSYYTSDSTSNWTIVTSDSTTATVNSYGNGYIINDSSGTSGDFWIDGGSVTAENGYHADYLSEMIDAGVPTAKQWRAELDPIDRKIVDERAWIQFMEKNAKERIREQAETVALELVTELFGSADADWLVVPSKLHPGRVYRVPIRAKDQMGSMVRVEENGKLLHKLCAHPSGAFPAGDHAITKALWLESNEAEYLKVANVH